MNQLRSSLEQGIPYYDMDSLVPKKELKARTGEAKNKVLVAHTALREAFKEGQWRKLTTMDGDKPGEGRMYITFSDANGEPCYFPWDKDNPATDIGLRAINPDYPGEVNPTTIIHADSEAAADFIERGAPHPVIEAVGAVARLNKFVATQIADPYLRRIAAAFEIDPEQYLENFLPSNRRARTLTRAILYHLHARPAQRPVGSDGAPLLIKEHNDKSSFTIDVEQSSPGLQYKVGDIWKDADTRIACFRGAADDYLPETTPPTLHRALFREELRQSPPIELSRAGIARIAIPSFISSSRDGARVVQAGSAETHPSTTTIS